MRMGRGQEAVGLRQQTQKKARINRTQRPKADGSGGGSTANPKIRTSSYREQISRGSGKERE